MKPQVPAATRQKARINTLGALQYAARQPSTTDEPQPPQTRQQARQHLRSYTSH